MIVVLSNSNVTKVDIIAIYGMLFLFVIITEEMFMRTNIKIIPDQVTISKILSLADKYNLPHQDFDLDPHCTIIYSNDVVDVKDIRLSQLNFPIVGKDVHFEFFDTRDDGIVLVVAFECEIASSLFAYLKKRYNLTTRYSEYKAHITLQKNIDNKDLLVVPEIDFDLSFDKIEMDNV